MVWSARAGSRPLRRNAEAARSIGALGRGKRSATLPRMGGVTTYQPPDAAAPDIGRADAAYAIHELIAHTARRCGYSAAQARAVRRMTELVDDCRWQSVP